VPTEIDLSSSSEEEENRIILLNVGGKRFSTTIATLTRFQSAYFQDILFASRRREEYFIDRNGKIFSDILDYMRDGLIFVPPPGTKKHFKLVREATFYGLHDLLTLCDPNNLNNNHNNSNPNLKQQQHQSMRRGMRMPPSSPDSDGGGGGAVGRWRWRERRIGR